MSDDQSTAASGPDGRSDPGGESVFRFLFRLSADARIVSLERFLRRLVTGLANHFHAATCSIYLDSAERLLASADPSAALDDLADQQAEALSAMQRELVTLAFERGTHVSALDIDTELLPNDWDVFGFPLNTSTGTRAVVVLFLDGDSRPIDDGSMQALLALGEVLEVGAENAPREPG